MIASAMIRPSCTATGLLAALAALTSAPASAQTAVGVRFGEGEGSARYNVLELHGRVHATDRFYGIGALQILGAGWACPATYGCGYDGYTASLGGSVALVDTRTFFVAARGSGGLFVRHESEFGRVRKLTGSLGVDAEAKLWGSLRVQVGVGHRSIFDGTYRDEVGTFPHVTALTVGIGAVFGQRDHGS